MADRLDIAHPDIDRLDIDRIEREIELRQLQLRFAAARVHDERAVRRLMQSIDACGQLVACEAVREAVREADSDAVRDEARDGDTAWVLIDGYRRVAALRRLGRDTAPVQCRSGSVAQALAQRLACAQPRGLVAIGQALLLRELVEGQRLSQGEAARECGREPSWVQRRLLLLAPLPEGVLDAVRAGELSSWAAARVFAPLARANAEHARRLLAGSRGQALSTRELQLWFTHYQRAQRREREHMVDHPRLLLDSLAECDQAHAAKRLAAGPEGQAVADLGHLQALAERARRHLAGMTCRPDEPVRRACARVRVRLGELDVELRRLLDDADPDPPQRADPAGPRPLAARDQPPAGAVA